MMSTRVLAFVLTVFLAFSLSACSQGTGSSPKDPVASGGGSLSHQPDSTTDSPAIPEKEPIGSPAVIRYPELADETLTSSGLYRQALERPSVILYKEEALTDPQPVRDFLDAVEKGEERDLYLYIFRYWEDYEEPYHCSYTHFATADGTVTECGSYEHSWDSLEEGGESTVSSIVLNEYGFLSYQVEGNSEPSGIQVVNDQDLYENAEELRRLHDTYLQPLSVAALASRSWASVEELSEKVDLVWLFEDIYDYENDGSPWDRFGSNWPLEEMVATLSRYFDGITPELVIGRKYADRYDAQTNTIFYEGGRGGMTPTFRVTGWEQEGELLKIDYETCEYFSGAPVEGSLYTLTIETMENGSFRYHSNLPRT